MSRTFDYIVYDEVGGTGGVHYVPLEPSHNGGGGEEEHNCCDLVVDPLTFAALLAAILGGTAFLNTLVTMNIGRKRRKRRTSSCGREEDGKLLNALKSGTNKFAETNAVGRNAKKYI